MSLSCVLEIKGAKNLEKEVKEYWCLEKIEPLIEERIIDFQYLVIKARMRAI